MSTNSYIAIKNDDKTIDYIYCHWDGYIENNGVLLQLYYNNKDRIRKLINLGSISSLEKKLNPDKTKPHTKFNYQENVVISYARDCNEELKINHSKNIEEFIKVCKSASMEYVYLYNNTKWYYCTNKNGFTFSLLSEKVIDAMFEDEVLCMRHFVDMPLDFQINFVGTPCKEDYIKLSKEDKQREIQISIKQMPEKVFRDLLNSLLNNEYGNIEVDGYEN